MFDYSMEHVCTYRANLQDPVIVSSAEGDVRVNFYVTDGEVWGPRLKGKVLPIGGDWLTLRRDGVCMLDVRAALQSEDGAHIDVAYNGVLDLGPDGHANFLKGVVPDLVKIRAAPRLRTAHPDYAWVNRVQFINIGEGRLKDKQVQYDVYALG